jgi:hypothetical protein
MRPFKFLNSLIPIFQFEICSKIDRTGNDCYTSELSDLIRIWMTNYYLNSPFGSPSRIHFSHLNKTCIIEEVSFVNRYNDMSNLLHVKILVLCEYSNMMKIELQYPVDFIIYR